MSAIIRLEPHRQDPGWLHTATGEPRGYIQPPGLSELWFHTGTACNLRCPFCFEGSFPGNHRLQQMTFDEVREMMEEALTLGVEKFSFTGGEPFVNRDMIRILDFALAHRPCLVLSNGTKPLRKRLEEVLPLRDRPQPLRFRISIDFPDQARHDAGRGAGNFHHALETAALLHRHGFAVSVARQSEQHEDVARVTAGYQACFREYGLPEDTHIIAFPDFHGPGAHPAGVPEITETCMTTHHSEASRAAFMCSYSKMVVKKDGRLSVYACTLVDDDEGYDLGGSLSEAMRYRVMLRHHRCFSCFACGASCSE